MIRIGDIVEVSEFEANGRPIRGKVNGMRSMMDGSQFLVHKDDTSYRIDTDMGVTMWLTVDKFKKVVV